MIRPLLLLPLLSLSACGLFFDHRPQLRFSGTLHASQPDACPDTRANLLIRQDMVTFAPDEGTWVLDGVADPETLTASRSRPIADHKVYNTELRARWSQTSVQGTYTTPRCTYRVDLKPY